MAQLELGLGDVIVSIPWNGANPRDLTRARKAFILQRELGKYECFFADPDQYDLFRAAIRGRRQYGGAPSLFMGV